MAPRALNTGKCCMSAKANGAGKVTTPLIRLQDAAYTKIILVALPEVIPVSQASALQDDLHPGHSNAC